MAIIRHRQGYIDVNPNPPPLGEPAVYDHEQNVELDPRRGLPKSGNTTQINLRTIYDAWLASYRGMVPHGINPLPITPGAAVAPAPNEFGAEMDDNPKTFAEATPETVAEGESLSDNVTQDAEDKFYTVPVTIVDDQSVSQDYFHVYRINVGATTPVMVVAQQKFRDTAHLVNLGNQTVWIAETESRLLDGWPMYAAPSGAPTQYSVATSREIWAIADPAAGSALMSVAVMITYDRGRNLK